MALNHKKQPLVITPAKIMQITGYSESHARSEINQIRAEYKESGKLRPRHITIAMYSKWSGISEEEINKFFAQ